LPWYAKGFIAIGTGVSEYFYQTAFKFLVQEVISPPFTKFFTKVFNFVGNGFPGFLIGTYIGITLHLPWWQVLAAGSGGGLLWGALARWLPKIFGASPWALIGGIAGPWIASQLGFTALWQQFLAGILGSVATTILGNFLWSFFGQLLLTQPSVRFQLVLVRFCRWSNFGRNGNNYRCWHRGNFDHHCRHHHRQRLCQKVQKLRAQSIGVL
jgi:hypothetical protein